MTMKQTKEQFIGITYEELLDENAKLRKERDHWHVEQVHAYGNWEDAYKRAAELELENAKLRELFAEDNEELAKMRRAIDYMYSFAKACGVDAEDMRKLGVIE